MKRDFNMIRNILLRVEAADGRVSVRELADLGELRIVAAHVEWLAEAKLIKVEHLILNSIEAAFDALILRQTWQGCEFLDLARDEATWNAIIAKTVESGRAAPFEALQTLLTQAVCKSVNS